MINQKENIILPKLTCICAFSSFCISICICFCIFCQLSEWQCQSVAGCHIYFAETWLLLAATNHNKTFHRYSQLLLANTNGNTVRNTNTIREKLRKLTWPHWLLNLLATTHRTKTFHRYPNITLLELSLIHI